MISYKVLMTLTVIFIISSEVGSVGDNEIATKVNDCKVILSNLGISNYNGFLNFCIARQFSDITQFRKSLETHRIAFINFTPGSRRMTVKEEILTKFYEDNYNIISRNKLCTPIDFCREYIADIGKSGFGCLSKMLRSHAKIEAKKTEQYRKCEEEITKKYESILTVTLASNEDGVERPQRQDSTSQTFSKGNMYDNVVVAYNLDFQNYNARTKMTIDEAMQSWPGSKQGYFNKLTQELSSQGKCTQYWTKTSWCMKYYNQQPIQGSTSGNNRR